MFEIVNVSVCLTYTDWVLHPIPVVGKARVPTSLSNSWTPTECVQELDLILTVSTWRQHYIPQVTGSAVHDYSLPQLQMQSQVQVTTGASD